SLANPAWQFRGATGATVYNLRIDAGADNLGTYQEIAFDYSISSSGRSASIRAYSGRPAVLFSATWNNTSSNTSPFPLFTSYPGNLLNLSFNGMFAYPVFSDLKSDSPWVFYDNAAN